MEKEGRNEGRWGVTEGGKDRRRRDGGREGGGRERRRKGGMEGGGREPASQGGKGRCVLVGTVLEEPGTVRTGCGRRVLDALDLESQ